MTVSRVINNQGLVKEATRQKVQKAIEELNYRPNLSARRLAGGKSLFIGLVYHNPSPSYLTKVLVGAMNGCRDNGHHLVLEDLGRHAPYHEPEKTARYLRSAGLDGVIITPPLSNHEVFISSLEKLGVAVVRVAPQDMHSESLRVAMDDVQAVKDMLKYAIDLGHKKIAFIKGPESHPSAHHRFEGFVQTMKKHGLDILENYLVQGDFTFKSGVTAGQELLKLPTPPTLIFASNDDMAAGVVATAHMLGFKIPMDISVIGFDDTEIAASTWPELTTIRQPITEMSVQAINLLSAHLQNDLEEVERHSQLLDFELIYRGSLCAPVV